MAQGDLDARMAFLAEADKLKQITRATTLGDGSRAENSAEHSWHLALYALVLGGHAPQGVDINRVIAMLLVHDLVEIDAGDVPIYANSDSAATAQAEAAAATRIFGLLPPDQGAETPDAQFAKALDRFQPPNQNLASDGASWRAHAPKLAQVEARVGAPIARSVPELWAWIAPQIRAWFARNMPRD